MMFFAHIEHIWQDPVVLYAVWGSFFVGVLWAIALSMPTGGRPV